MTPNVRARATVWGSASHQQQSQQALSSSKQSSSTQASGYGKCWKEEEVEEALVSLKSCGICKKTKDQVSWGGAGRKESSEFELRM